MCNAAFALASVEGVLLSVDARFCSIIRRSRKELLGRSVFDFTLASDRAANLAKVQALRATGQSFTIRKHYLSPDGQVIAVENDIALVRDVVDAPRMIASVTELAAAAIDDPVGPGDLLDVAKAIAGEWQMRCERAPVQWRTGPTWEIVLAAYICEIEGRAGLVGEVLGRANLPLPVARAAFDTLVRHGIVMLEDSGVGELRQRAVRLTTETHATLEEHLTSLCA